MSYIINKSDGSVLTEVVDGTIDQLTTQLTLVGKNASSYGEFFNENFVHLLENFASELSPQKPITGQTWYDTTEGRLKVYDGAGFKVSGGSIISTSIPLNITAGDIWIDSEKQQLHFNDGTNTILAGPVYTAQQGISGFSVEDILDNYNISHTIVKMYVAQTLIGIYSKDEFIPGSSIAGYSGTIKVGFNIGSSSGLKYNVTASQADALVSYHPITGALILRNASSFVSTTDNSTTSGSLTIQNATPLILGLNQNNEFLVSASLFSINSNISDQNFEINCLNGEGLLPSIHVNAQNKHVGLYTDLPTATLDVNGDVRVRGDFIVEGNTTTVNTTNIQVEDLLIELGAVDTPTNSTANGGGISLQAGLDGDKTITWQSGNTAWKSSEHFDLFSGKGYHVNGFEVLNQTTLGATVTSAPGLTSIGTLTSLQVSNLSFASPGNISFVNALIPNGSITLTPKGTGTVDVNSSKITSVADPVDSSDAVNYGFMTAQIRTKSVGIALDTNGMSDTLIASTILDIIFPSDDFDNNTKCRIYCSDLGISKLFTLVSGVWQYTSPL